MRDTKFTAEHEWIRRDNDGTAAVGITDYAQQQLGDVVFVELPQIGRRIRQGEDTAVIESVKAAAEVKAPASGEVTAVNDALVDEPQRVNTAPEGDGWFFRLKLAQPAELDTLMDADAYAAFLKTLA